MQQMQAQLGFVSSEKFIEARLVVRCQQSHPGGSNGLMIEMSDAMVQRECLNPGADAEQRAFKAFSMQVQPCQTQVVGMPELGSQQPSAVKSFEKFFIAKMSGGQKEGHNVIMTAEIRLCCLYFALCRDLLAAARPLS